MKHVLHPDYTVTTSSGLTQASLLCILLCLSGHFMVNVLTVENVTGYAQDVMPLMPLDCEWGGMCESELNSWSSLREVSIVFLCFFDVHYI